MSCPSRADRRQCVRASSNRDNPSVSRTCADSERTEIVLATSTLVEIGRANNSFGVTPATAGRPIGLSRPAPVCPGPAVDPGLESGLWTVGTRNVRADSRVGPLVANPARGYPLRWRAAPGSCKQSGRRRDVVERTWGSEVDLTTLAPSVATDERFRQWWVSYLRWGASPGAAVALARMNSLPTPMGGAPCATRRALRLELGRLDARASNIVARRLDRCSRRDD